MATNLNHQWMPFTDNREFQRAPQLFVRAEGVRYWNAEGRELLKLVGFPFRRTEAAPAKTSTAA